MAQSHNAGLNCMESMIPLGDGTDPEKETLGPEFFRSFFEANPEFRSHFGDNVLNIDTAEFTERFSRQWKNFLKCMRVLLTLEGNFWPFTNFIHIKVLDIHIRGHRIVPAMSLWKEVVVFLKNFIKSKFGMNEATSNSWDEFILRFEQAVISYYQTRGMLQGTSSSSG